MSKLRASALGAAAILVVVHLALVASSYGTRFASVWGHWTDAVSALFAAIVCWFAARQSGAFGRRVWRLVSLSLALAFLSQFAYTFYFDYLHAPYGAIWPSDVLVFFWAVPAMMTLFLSPRDPDKGFRWLRLCDFLQVCALVLSLELSLLYVPSRWQSSEGAMFVRTFHVALFFFSLLALSFLMRGLLTPVRAARPLFFQLAAFFFFFGITTNTTRYAISAGVYREGTWLDLPWTLSFCLLAGFAATWTDSEQNLPKAEPRATSMRLLAQFSPLLIPAIVFPLVLRIAQEQFLWSVILAMVSFAAAGGRMFVVQNELLISSRELQKNLALLRGITEGTTDAVFVKDLQGRYLMINSAGGRFLGRRTEEVIGRNDVELFNPEQGREIMKRDREAMQSGSMQTYEEGATSGGVARTYLSNKGPFRDPNGEVVGLLGICRDITDRKDVEEEIYKSEQRLRGHVEHTPLAVIEWDLEFRVVSWNPAAERIFGYSRAEAIGQHGSFTVPAQFHEHVDRVWEDLLAQRGGARSTNDNITKDGRTISCEGDNTPLVDDSGRVLGGASLVQDVTERVVLEERFRQSQKMEAVGRLAGGIAHDFNNLLMVIQGYADLLAERLPEGDSLRRNAEQIQIASQRATSLTQQLLAFSRKQMLAPKILNVQSVVGDMEKILRRLIGEDIEFETFAAKDLGLIKADRSQIEQVVMNLAVNARDAMPSGGRLTIETANVELDSGFSHVPSVLAPGKYVMLAVTDNGTGMDAATQAHIFEPFFTTKEKGKGTGLGLATVYGIVKQSGGYVWVYSEVGHGTTFKIYLPRIEDQNTPTPPEHSETRSL